jgi:hypothetical protein
MASVLHVTPRLGRWAVVHEGEQEPLAEFDEHEQAEQWARRHARDHGEAEIHVHARRGGVRDILPPLPPDVPDERASRGPPFPPRVE